MALRATCLALAMAACGGRPATVTKPPSPMPTRLEVMPHRKSAAPAPAPVAEPVPTMPTSSVTLAAVLPVASAWPWPLTEGPSLQPHWDPAMARDACEPAWASRHSGDADARAYVAAWCRIRASERGAVDELGKLARSARPEPAKAARLDAVNLLADYMDAPHALAWLGELSLDDVPTIDALAATYFVLGSRDDFATIEQTIAKLDPYPSPDVACERLIAFATVDDPQLQQKLWAVADDKGHCEQLADDYLCVLQHVDEDGAGVRVIRRCLGEYEGTPDLLDKIKQLQLAHRRR